MITRYIKSFRRKKAFKRKVFSIFSKQLSSILDSVRHSTKTVFAKDTKFSWKELSFETVKKQSYKILKKTSSFSKVSFKKLKNLKKQDIENLFTKKSFENLYQVIYKMETKQKVIFSISLIFVAGIFSIIRHNQNTMVPDAVFRRSVLSSWDYTSERNSAGMRTRLKKEKTALAILVERENSSIEFKLPINNPSLKVRGNTATYTNKDKSIEVKYEIFPNKLKESIILNSSTTNSEFISSFLVQNLIVKMNNENIPVFFDTKNNYQFHLERPYATDATGNTTFDLVYELKPKSTNIKNNPFKKKPYIPGENLLGMDALSEIQVNTNEYELVVSVNPEWLLSAKRQYPIIIDPTITHDTTAEFAVGEFNRLIDSGSGSSPVLETYYQEATADEHTVGLWHMNETADNSCSGGEDACDSSGNENHGTATGTTIIDARMSKGRSFNGSSDYVNAGNGSSLPNSGDITLSAWFKTSESGNHTMIASHGTTNDWLYWFGKNTSDLFNCKFYQNNSGNAYLEASSSMTINDGTWHHGTCIMTGTSIYVYVDGKLVGSDITTTGTRDTSTAGNLSIGRYNWTTTFNWNGQIDEVRISNIARTPEEIKAAAARRPYSVYTSDVVDFAGAASSWTSFIWTESGVATGDGETLYDNTSLVAQWNFNETSGTTADNAEGTAALDGSLSGFDSTASQDADPDSSWTANNKRWGAGGLMFDGVNSYVSVPDNATLDLTTAITVETWVNPKTIGHQSSILNKQGSATDRAYILYTEANNLPRFTISFDGSATTGVTATTPLTTGGWYHLVATYDNSNIKIYVNGKLENTTVASGSINNSSDQLEIGWIPGWASGYYFNGSIDSTRLYSRALTAAEILSNYNSSNIELQTRVGADTSPNDGSWDAWASTSSETAIDSFDSDITPASISDLRLWLDANDLSTITKDGSNNVSQWDDKSGNAYHVVQATGAQQPNYTTGIINGKPVIRFTASTSDTMTNATNFGTACTVIYVSKQTGGTNGRMLSGLTNNWLLGYHATLKRRAYFEGWLTSPSPASDTSWHIFSATIGGTGVTSTAYENGSVYISGQGGVDCPNGVSLNGYLGASEFSDGDIAEVIAYDRMISQDELWLVENYLANKYDLKINTPFRTPLDSTIKQEGTYSKKLTVGQLDADPNTVGLWHLDETNGDNAGNDVFDSTSNNNDGEFYGTNIATAVVDGISGKAREFNGTDDAIDAGDIEMGSWTDITMEAWFKTSATPGTAQRIIAKDQIGVSGNFLFHINSSNQLSLYIYDSAIANWSIVTSTDTFTDGNWHHAAGVVNNVDNLVYLYADGVLVDSAAFTATTLDDTDNEEVVIGADSDVGSHGQLFDGSIDEVRISNIARSSEEIAESYRLGRDYYLNKTISSTDLSSKSSLPFYIAADRPGTYLESIIGESAYANYQPDANTVGLWHLDDDIPYETIIHDNTEYTVCASSTSCTLSNMTINNSGDNNRLVVVGVTTEGLSDITNVTFNGVAGTEISEIDFVTGGTISVWYFLDSELPSSNGNYNVVSTVTPSTSNINLGVMSFTGVNQKVYDAVATNSCAACTAISQSITTLIDNSVVVDVVHSGQNRTFTATNSIIKLWQADSSSSTGSGGYKIVSSAGSTTGGYTVESSSNRLGYVITAFAPAKKIIDSSGNANHGTPVGTTFTQGKIGKGRSFNGSSDYINTGSTFPTLTNDFSISFWVKPGSSQGVYADIFGGHASYTGMVMQQDNAITNKYYFLWGNGSAWIGWQASYPYFTLNANQWQHIGITKSSTAGANYYLNGTLIANIANNTALVPHASYTMRIGQGVTSGTRYFNGSIDEFRIDDTIRTASEIRQAYEVGLRTHPITIDFAASGDSGNLITGSGDTSFTIDATAHGLTSKGSALYKGDKIIVRENDDGTEYIAQGTVTAITTSTGATTVASWNAGSTFPASGYTANASFFKWQREYWPIADNTLSTHMDAITNLTFRLTNGHEGRTIWLDDLRSNSNYLTNPLGSTIASLIGKQYFQYRSIFTSNDPFVSSSLSSVSFEATTGPTPTPTLVPTPTPTPLPTPIPMDILNGESNGANSCYLEESPQDNQVIIHWTDGATDEIGYEIERQENGIWQTIDITSPNAESYSDNSVSSGNFYRYKVRKLTDDGGTGEWCGTPMLSLKTGNSQLEGLQLEGIKLD